MSGRHGAGGPSCLCDGKRGFKKLFPPQKRCLLNSTVSLFYCGHRNYSLRDRNLGTCTKACVYNLKKTLLISHQLKKFLVKLGHIST